MALKPLIRFPAAYMWKIAINTAGNRGFRFSPECASSMRERFKSCLEVYKIGLYEFRERIKEAETSIETLVDLMIAEEIAINLESKTLHEPSLFAALYTRDLCPGLWPLC